MWINPEFDDTAQRAAKVNIKVLGPNGTIDVVSRTKWIVMKFY